MRHPAMFCHCECRIANQIPCLLNHTVCDCVKHTASVSETQTNTQSVMITRTKKKKMTVLSLHPHICLYCVKYKVEKIQNQGG